MPDDRFISPALLPDAHQREVGIILGEECGEIIRECLDVQARTSKLLRFGIDEIQPGQAKTNAERLGEEIGDLLETVDLAIAAGIVSPSSIDLGRQRKARQLAKFLQADVTTQVQPQDRVGDWIQTASGRCFWPLDPRPEEIHIEDIARSLANRCRYAGHLGRKGLHYSVAEHSVLVSEWAPKEHALWGLLHDSPEAFTSDIPRPLKRFLPDWKPMEAKIMRAVCERYGLPLQEPQAVSEIDWAITADEREALMAPSERDWGPLPPKLGALVVGLSAAEAEDLFLTRFEQLTNG